MALISINEVEAAALVPSLSALNEKLSWGAPEKDAPVIHAQDVEICC